MHPEEPFFPSSPLPPSPKTASDIIPQTPQEQPTNFPESQNPSKLPKLLAAAVVLAVLGVAAYAFSSFHNPTEKIAAKIREEVAKITSGKFAAHAELRFTPDPFFSAITGSEAETLTPPSKIRLDLNADGVFDVTKDNPPKSALRVFGAIEGISQDPLDVDLKLSVLGQALYFKLAKLPSTEGLDPSSLVGTWFFLETKPPAQVSAAETLQLEAGGSADADLQNAKQFYSQLSRLYSKSFKLTKTLGSEEMSGQKVRHYQAAIDIGLLSEELDKYQKTAADPAQQTFAEIVRANLQGLQSFTAELWMGQKDYLPYRLQFDIPLGIMGGTLAFSIQFSDYNQPVEITAPEDARNFEAALRQVFDQTQATTPQETPNK